MSVFDKFLDNLKIENDDDYYDDYDEVDVQESKTQPALPKDDQGERDVIKKIPNTRPQSNKNVRKNNSGMEVVNVKPKAVEDGRKISDFLLENKVVFLDLEGIDMNIAQRIIDFVSGATYAIDGTLQQVSRYTFLIAPAAVSVSGDFQDSVVGNTQVTF